MAAGTLGLLGPSTSIAISAMLFSALLAGAIVAWGLRRFLSPQALAIRRAFAWIGGGFLVFAWHAAFETYEEITLRPQIGFFSFILPILAGGLIAIGLVQLAVAPAPKTGVP